MSIRILNRSIMAWEDSILDDLVFLLHSHFVCRYYACLFASLVADLDFSSAPVIRLFEYSTLLLYSFVRSISCDQAVRTPHVIKQRQKP